MKKKLLATLLTVTLVLSLGIASYAETQTLHTTEFTADANVNPNTSGSIWNSSGIFQYEQDGSKVVFDSTDLKKIGEELTKINTDIQTMNTTVSNADTTVLARKAAMATKLNALYTEINTQLSTSLPTNYTQETTFETMITDLETAKNILNESLNDSLILPDYSRMATVSLTSDKKYTATENGFLMISAKGSATGQSFVIDYNGYIILHNSIPCANGITSHTVPMTKGDTIGVTGNYSSIYTCKFVPSK